MFGDLVHSVYKIGDTCVGQYGNEVGMHEIDPSTICQRTGLKDKNGKLIWRMILLNVKIENTIFKRKLNGMLIVLDLYFKIQKHLRLSLMQ